MLSPRRWRCRCCSPRAGCRSSDAFTGPDPLAGRPPLGHDVLTLQAVIAAEENLIDLYRTAINGDSPASAGRPGHGRSGRCSPSTSSTSRGSGPGSSCRLGRPRRHRRDGPPGRERDRQLVQPRPARVSTAQLRAAERASAADLVQRLATVPPALAQLLASIAASDATHVTVLGG